MSGSIASQRGENFDTTMCLLRIGCYNVGVHQNMLTSKRAQRHLQRLEDIIATCVHDAGLHIMNFCELGGHHQGLSTAGIRADDLRSLQVPRTSYVSINDTLTAWTFDADATQFGVRATEPVKMYSLNSTKTETELVVHSFQIDAGFRLILGNLLIRTSQGANGTVNMKQRLVRQALQQLESNASSDTATQPVVQVLVGDCNLTPEKAKEAAQPLQPADANRQTVWQVHATDAALPGDLMFVKGAHAMSFDLPYGYSHRDRGIAKDCHDAFAIELRVMIQPVPAAHNHQTEHDSQLARYDDDAAQ